MNTDILEFIKSCIRRRKIYWTYHVNMRLKKRFIPRKAILASVDSYETSISRWLTRGDENFVIPEVLIGNMVLKYRQQTIHIPDRDIRG